MECHWWVLNTFHSIMVSVMTAHLERRINGSITKGTRETWEETWSTWEISDASRKDGSLFLVSKISSIGYPTVG